MLPSRQNGNMSLTHRDSRSMSSDLDIVSGRMRGIAATQVLNRSILGFLSPLSRKERIVNIIVKIALKIN